MHGRVMSIRRFLSTSLLLLAACNSDPNKAVCEHYAKLATDCREDKSDSAGAVSDTAQDFCQKGMSGKHEDIFGPRYRSMIECTRKAKDCAAFKACEDGLVDRSAP